MSKRPLHNVILTNEGKQYHGSPCDKCGSTLRWFVNRSCVSCQRDRNRIKIAEKRRADRVSKP